MHPAEQIVVKACGRNKKSELNFLAFPQNKLSKHGHTDWGHYCSF